MVMMDAHVAFLSDDVDREGGESGDNSRDIERTSTTNIKTRSPRIIRSLLTSHAHPLRFCSRRTCGYEAFCALRGSAVRNALRGGLKFSLSSASAAESVRMHAMGPREERHGGGQFEKA